MIISKIKGNNTDNSNKKTWNDDKFLGWSGKNR